MHLYRRYWLLGHLSRKLARRGRQIAQPGDSNCSRMLPRGNRSRDQGHSKPVAARCASGPNSPGHARRHGVSHFFRAGSAAVPAMERGSLSITGHPAPPTDPCQLRSMPVLRGRTPLRKYPNRHVAQAGCVASTGLRNHAAHPREPPVCRKRPLSAGRGSARPCPRGRVTPLSRLRRPAPALPAGERMLDLPLCDACFPFPSLRNRPETTPAAPARYGNPPSWDAS